jgi:hypothetical protein
MTGVTATPWTITENRMIRKTAAQMTSIPSNDALPDA